ncbi:Protein of unknown function [Gryllus bimaculatus]|nr:Protein of unknown function [Gryllus bimaculatus]
MFVLVYSSEVFILLVSVAVPSLGSPRAWNNRDDMDSPTQRPLGPGNGRAGGIFMPKSTTSAPPIETQ